MLIELPGAASRFDDLEPGSFFMFQRTKPEFGLCVSVDHIKSAVIFSYSEQHHAPLWLAVGGLPNDVLINLPHAVVRSDLSSVAVFDRNTDSGGLISADGEVYIRAKESFTSHFTFNMKTGERARLRHDASTITFSQWRVGLLIGEHFDPIFEFQSNTP
jgi:hypothetical protein